MSEFPENLRELINEKEKSLRKIGSETGLRSGQLSEYLKGSFPSIEKAVKLAEYFDCSLDYLFGVSEERKHLNCILKPFCSDTFVKRYEALLRENSTTHWQLAQRSEISESCLRHWKKGRKPSTGSLRIIAKELNGSIDYLIGLIDSF